MTFDAVGPLSGVTFTSGGSEAVVTEAGTYLVYPTISPADDGRFTVELNGAPVAGGVLPNVDDSASGPVIVTAAAGDRISVVNTDSTPATLAASASGVPNASLYIQSLSTTPAA